MPRSKLYPQRVERVATIERHICEYVTAMDEDLLTYPKTANLVHQLAWTLHKLQTLQKEIDESDFIQQLLQNTTGRVPAIFTTIQMLQKSYLAMFNALYKILDMKMKEKAKKEKNKVENPLMAFQKAFAI